MLVTQSCETAAAEWNFKRHFKIGLTVLFPREKECTPPPKETER